jgi:hypothetical protein
LLDHRQALFEAWRLTGIHPAGTSHPLGKADGEEFALCENLAIGSRRRRTRQITLVQKPNLLRMSVSCSGEHLLLRNILDRCSFNLK